MKRARLSALASLAVVAILDPFDPAGAWTGFNPPDVIDLTVQSFDQSRTFTLEVADDHFARAKGLAGQRDLPPDHGMIFTYPTPRTVRFTFTETLVALDIAFVDRTGRITEVAFGVPAGHASILPSPAPICAVIEVAANDRSRQVLVPGARIVCDHSVRCAHPSPTGGADGGRCPKWS